MNRCKVLLCCCATGVIAVSTCSRIPQQPYAAGNSLTIPNIL
jgi:hypothetical protein